MENKDKIAKLKADNLLVIKQVEAEIMEWTEMKELEYRLLIYNTGIEFLEIMEGDGQYFKRLQTQKSFWHWWANKWFSRDAAFLRMRLEDLKHLRSRHIQKAYKQWHDLDYLRKDTPLESSYYRLLHAIIN